MTRKFAEKKTFRRNYTGKPVKVRLTAQEKRDIANFVHPEETKDVHPKKTTD